MDHSYEEIREIAIALLSGRETPSDGLAQYEQLKLSITEVIRKREGSQSGSRSYALSGKDKDLCLEIFWDLFRQGIITLGLDDQNREFPFFRISSFGKKILDNETVYFFHDLSSYEKLILEEIPDIDDMTILYLKEAMQAFFVECRLSSSVLLGVAIENALECLYDSINANGKYKDHFRNVREERSLHSRFTKFKNKLTEINKDLPPEIKSNLGSNLDMIVSIIRNYRNESGHPSGEMITREQCYVNLQLFIPCYKKIYELKKFFDERERAEISSGI